MEEKDQNIIKNDLQQIAEMLILNGTLTVCPGLVHGKTGVAIFFFQYARFTGNMLFADYAMDLIGEVQKQIHADDPVDYERGIAGIGVGIDFLIRNQYLDIEEDIWDDFDKRMYRAVMYDPWMGFSLYDGLVGYGRYWISRLRQQPLCIQARECLQYVKKQIEENLPDIPLEEQTDVYCFLHDLHGLSGLDFPKGVLGQFRKAPANVNRGFLRFNNNIIGTITRIYQRSLYFDDISPNEFDIALNQIPILDKGRPPSCIGLLNGYAGEGLMRLIALDPTGISLLQLL